MKKLLFNLIFAFITTAGFTQTTYQLSSHILDITKGMPASDVTIKLEKLVSKSNVWMQIDEKTTDKNGRVADFLPNTKANDGIYRLTFEVADYFKNNNTESFYPFIEVVFEIKGTMHFHVPITLSAFGYSTYRGN